MHFLSESLQNKFPFSGEYSLTDCNVPPWSVLSSLSLSYRTAAQGGTWRSKCVCIESSWGQGSVCVHLCSKDTQVFSLVVWKYEALWSMVVTTCVQPEAFRAHPILVALFPLRLLTCIALPSALCGDLAVSLLCMPDERCLGWGHGSLSCGG